MNFLKLMPTALLMSLSLSAFAQDEDEQLQGVDEEETSGVVVSSAPTDKKTFHRVQLGYTGTIVKYTNFGDSPDYNNYYLNGVNVGWMGDLRIAKKIDLFLELGANLTYHVGSCKDKRWNVHHDEYYRYKVNAFSLTIPVSINKQFKNVFGVENLTIAPLVGVYARFNVMAKRKATAFNEDGSDAGKTYTASLMKADQGPTEYGESNIYLKAIEHKLHVGKLLQVGAQVGVNAYYKNYSFGFAYMRDLTPFACHKSSPELTSKETPQGGNLPNIGTDCDMKISTANNFLITVGYIF